jgi:Spy/CpxP family protein refolding chaperone
MRDHGPGPDMRGPDRAGPRGGERLRDEGGPDGLGGMRVPPGTWWRNPEIAGRIGLSTDQVKRIDGIFLDSRIQLIHMHASLEEEQLRLEPLLSANPVNQQAALEQISKIADTRADLEKANAKMLLSIRGVLTSDQWTKLQQPPMRPRRDGPGRPDAREPGAPNPTAQPNR